MRETAFRECTPYPARPCQPPNANSSTLLSQCHKLPVSAIRPPAPHRCGGTSPLTFSRSPSLLGITVSLSRTLWIMPRRPCERSWSTPRISRTTSKRNQHGSINSNATRYRLPARWSGSARTQNRMEHIPYRNAAFWRWRKHHSQLGLGSGVIVFIRNGRPDCVR